MRRIAVLTIALLAMLAARMPAAAEDNQISWALRPGGTANFNQVDLRCDGRRATIHFSSSFGEGEAWGRGALGVHYADCRLANGTSIRVKAGYMSPPQPWGVCGGDPGKMLSIWIDRRKIISRLTYVPYCSERVLKSIEIDAHRAIVCTLPASEGQDENRQYSALPAKSTCTTYSLKGARDTGEFPRKSGPGREVGEFYVAQATPNPCEQFIDPDDRTRLTMPKTLSVPAWASVKPAAKQPDISKVKFNATTFSSPDTKSARFDLENDGHTTLVYQHDEDNHWFAGSAIARDRSGILTTPFDAHDWDRSKRDGIYAFVYERATVFFQNGKTYVLLDPENLTHDPRVITLKNGNADLVCTITRQNENF